MNDTPETPNPQTPPVSPFEPSKDEKNLAMLAHLLGIFFYFIPALVIWLMKKDSSKYVEDQAKEALNFQIVVTVALTISATLIFAFVGCVMYPAVWIIDLIFCIKAAMAASNGVLYRYPWTIRLVK